MKSKDLEYTPKSAWEVYSSPEQRQAMDELAVRYLDFLSRCKTERETVAYVIERLGQSKFTCDFKTGVCFRAQHDKTLFISRRGRRPLSEGFRLLGAHCDAPRLDLKQRPLYEDQGLGLGKTHYYGGIRKYQWLGRELALHGVIVKQSGEVINVSIGEDPSDPVFTITDLLPHLASKQMEQKLSEAFEAEKMNLVLGHAAGPYDKKTPEGEVTDKYPIKARVLELLHERYGIIEEDLYSAELQVVPAGPARFVGLDRSILGGYGQDDRICVFTALEALLAEENPEYTQMVLFWDKEEIGSEGATSARSLFFLYCVEDLIRFWEPDARMSTVMEAGKAISADVNAAVDPDHQELYEKMNAAYLGHGPCFSKFTGHRGKIGANDANAEYISWLRRILNEAGVPWQMAELGKVDIGGGGTVAKHLAIYGMDIIDCGPAVLSMHSPFELTSKADLYATMEAYRAFLRN